MISSRHHEGSLVFSTKKSTIETDCDTGDSCFKTAGNLLSESLTKMKLVRIPFAITDWSRIPATEYQGEYGTAYWRTQHLGGIRVRMVEYTAGYLADHWCSKGHILLCLSGEVETELKDGRKFTLTPGMSYQVADDVEPHRSSSTIGATLFIVD